MGNANQPKTCCVCGSELKEFKTDLHFTSRYFCCINLNPDRNHTVYVCPNRHNNNFRLNSPS